MNKSVLYIAALAALFMGSCKQDATTDAAQDHTVLAHVNETLPAAEFEAWVANPANDLLKSKAINDLDFKLCYMPKEKLAINELKGEAYTEAQFRDACAHYKGMSYFDLRIGLIKGSGELLKYELASPQQYNDRIDYMSFRMQKNIFLVQGKDTLYPGLYHFERIFEVAPFATVMLAFDNQKFDPKEQFTIVYDDQLFHKGYIKYNYGTNQLIDLPTTPGV